MTLRFLTSGESHGPAITTILDGLPAGLPLTPLIINRELIRRQKGIGAGPRMKTEHDSVYILGGVMAGATTGAPLSLFIENKDHAKWRGRAIPPFTIPRPGHADLTGALKYGYRDLRPALERASARTVTPARPLPSLSRARPLMIRPPSSVTSPMSTVRADAAMAASTRCAARRGAE